MLKLKVSMAAVLCAMIGSGFAYSFNPEDIDAFNKTNACPSCNLSDMVLGGNHTGCNLTGVNLTNATLNGNYSQGNFSNANLAQGTVNGNLTYANFTGAILIRTNFSNSNLEHVDFTNAVINGTSFANADLFGAKLTAEQLAKANVCNAIMPDGSAGKCES